MPSPLRGQLRARPSLHSHREAFFSSQSWGAPGRDHCLDLPATHGTLGCVPEDPPGTVAAEVCVAAGHKAGVGSMVETDGTLLSYWSWERGQRRSGHMGGRVGSLRMI